MLAPEPSQAALQTLRVTVRDGLAGVNRLIGVLRLRGTTPRTITASVTAGTETWTVQHTLITTNDQTKLLQRQLQRLPCVVHVTTLTTDDPA
jgi:acetolactate synthase regulatory subunit